MPLRTPAPPVTPPVADGRRLRVLATDRRAGGWDVADVVRCDGLVAVRLAAGWVRRAESGPFGPLLLDVRAVGDTLELAVAGDRRTPPDAAARALDAAAAWVGCADSPPPDFGRLIRRHHVLAEAHRRFGTPRLGQLPAVDEAVGRSVIGQLVQAIEARRSEAQLVRLLGDRADAQHCWPTRTQVAATPAWRLRHCGIALRSAQALHAVALTTRRLEESLGYWDRFDERLRALPGIGMWTSGKARGALGDPDAVPVGDYNLPSVVCHNLTDVPADGPAGRWTDAPMLEVLAPYAGQRARVIRLVKQAVRARLATRPPRRAPRAAPSAHRYW